MEQLPPDFRGYCRFTVVRHGETEWNVQHKIQGQTDSPLTENGVAQAKAAAADLKDVKFDLAFSSDLLRAQRTAEIIAMEHDLTVTTTKMLRERAFGSFEGKPSDMLRKVEALLEAMSDQERFQYKITEDIESEEEVVFRMLAFMRELAVFYPDKNILITTHGGAMRSLLIHLGYATFKTFPPRGIGNTAYIKLLSDGTDFFIETTKGVAPPLTLL